MTFRDYIRIMASTKIFIGSQEQLVMDLFEQAGAIIYAEANAVKSWLKPETSKGFRKCKIRKYFPDDAIEETGFIKFIRNRTNTSWKKLQKAFRTINEDGMVNTDTDDPAVFYWSLLNQFQKIHRLPLSEMPTKEMQRLFKDAVERCEVSAFFEAPESISDDANVLEKVKNLLGCLASDIIEPFQSRHNESLLYRNITEFHSELESLIVLCSPHIGHLLSYYKYYHDSIDDCYRRVNTIYREIYGIYPQCKCITLKPFSFETEP